MARVPYIDDTSNPQLTPLADRIRAERGGRLFNLYKILLNNPRIAEGWLALFTAIRQQSELHGRYRELAIMMVAVINAAEYEYVQHIPFALKAGLTQAQLDALRDWRSSALFEEAGFGCVGAREYLDSTIPGLADVERPSRLLDGEGIAVEGKRPGTCSLQP